MITRDQNPNPRDRGEWRASAHAKRLGPDHFVSECHQNGCFWSWTWFEVRRRYWVFFSEHVASYQDITGERIA